MGVAWYPVLQLKVSIVELDKFNGKALGRNGKTLEIMAKEIRVNSLMSFFGDDASEFLAEEGIDLGGQDTGEKWFDAREGLETVSILLKTVAENQAVFTKADDLLKDLEYFQHILLEAEKQNVKWHLAIDF